MALFGAVGVFVSACETNAQIAQDRMNDIAIMHHVDEAECRQTYSPKTKGYASCMAGLRQREVSAYQDMR